MGELKYLPVEIDPVKKSEIRGTVYIKSDKIGPDFSIRVTENCLKKSDDLKAEGAEEYRKALCDVLGTFSSEALTEAFGEAVSPGYTLKDWCQYLVENFSPSQFLSRLRIYENKPKERDVWQSNKDGYEVVILANNGKNISFVYVSREHELKVECFAADKFRNCFHKTDRPSCESLGLFLKDLRKLKS